MRFGIGLRSLAMVLIATVLPQGCSQFAPHPPVTPTARELTDFSQELANLPSRDPVALVKLGYALSDDQCDRFFIALQAARNKNDYDAAELSALNSFITPGMTALKAGAKAVGITGGLFGFGTATSLNYAKFMLLTEYNTELQDLVHSAKISYKKQVDHDNSVMSSTYLADAYTIIGGYAWLCTLPGIDSLARAALSTGAEATGTEPNKTTSPPAPAPAAPAAPAPSPRRFRAPPAAPPFAPPGSVTAPQITVIR